MSDNGCLICPYDEAHKPTERRFQIHIAKCSLNHLDKVKASCPFNATHIFAPSERDFHLMNCPDRTALDLLVSQNALDKNNPFIGRTAVPKFSDPLLVPGEEAWDDVLAEGYVPCEPPPSAIIEPPPMAKPAERRKLYRELYREQVEDDSSRTASTSKPSSMPRQPKQPSETQKLQNVSQNMNSHPVQNLRWGRGRPPRIAANIFGSANGAGAGVNLTTYDNIIKDLSNVDLGRGQSVTQIDPIPLLNEDKDFPALGCGRGVLHSPKQGHSQTYVFHLWKKNGKYVLC